jgi:general L-amino acid transport system substrate-binding protein
MHFRVGIVAAWLLLIPAAAKARPSTLAKVRATNSLNCGVIQEDAEYSTEDNHGSRGQFDYDICRAIAIALIGPNAVVKLITFLDSETASTALREGKVEVVASMSANLANPTTPDIHVTRPILYDGVGFLVSRASQITHAQDLAGRKICFLAETEVEVSLHTWSEQQHLDFLPFPFQEEGEMEAAYITNNCAAITGDLTRLAGTRASFGSIAKNYEVMPEVISSDPLAAATSTEDAQWSMAVALVIDALIATEECGVTSTNAEQALTTSETCMQKRMPSHDIEVRVGLRKNWIVDMMKATGNCGEIFDRTFGSNTNQPMPRHPSTSLHDSHQQATAKPDE